MERVMDYADGPPLECRRLEHLLAGLQMYIGHDLANQLVAIQGLARHLESEAPASDPDLLARLASLARRADLHGRRVAEIGRLVREPNPEQPVPLLEVAREAAAAVKAALRANGDALPLDIDVVVPMPSLKLSGKLLYRVLVELLDNAVAARTADRPTVVTIQSRLEGQNCIVQVRDDGRGVSAAELARLGEPAVVSAASHVQALGYFLIVQAAALWRGRLTIRTEPGAGTTVELWLPREDP